MCGIFAYLGTFRPIDSSLENSFNKIKNRGPDGSSLVCINEDKKGDNNCDSDSFNNNCEGSNYNSHIIFGFHRLAVIDLSDGANQPMTVSGNSIICNGEIFNYKKLIADNDFKCKTGSDCEVVLHMFNKYGIEKTVRNLDAEFAFVLYDSKEGVVYAARDPFGVRPLFIGYDDEFNYYICSEIKGISDLCTKIMRFRPGCYWSSKTYDYVRYYNYSYPIGKDYMSLKDYTLDEICSGLKEKLVTAVRKRLMSDRPVGCLLSGGLDSSLITSIVSKEFKAQNKCVLNTFSIGMEGSTDLYYAKKVADYIGSKHHHIELTPTDFLRAIPEVIYNIESYDTTTVRASVGNYLVAKYIKENTDITVVYNGDGSDEQSGYLYLRNAPDADEFQEECVSLLKNIHMFDCLRSDRSVSSRWSLESRTPFLDKDFVDYYMSIDPTLKMYGKNDNRIEKFLLRKAFEEGDYLPKEVLWRRKEAFSDGCSSVKNSWHSIITDFVNEIISDEDYEFQRKKYKTNRPQLKETLFYRKIYDHYYSYFSNVIDFYWLPKWCGGQIDPSARELDGYKQEQV